MKILLLQITSDNTIRDSSDTSQSVSYTFYQQKTFHRKKRIFLFPIPRVSLNVEKIRLE